LAVLPEVAREASHLLDPAAWKAKVARDWKKLATAPAEVRDQPDVMLQAVKDSWGDALCYASAARQSDRDLVLEAVQLRGMTLQYASKELRDDPQVVRAAVEQDWQAFRCASARLQADRGLATLAVAQQSEALEHVSSALKADRDFMLKAVLADGRSLRYALGDVARDRELCLAAFKQNSLAFQWVPEELRQSLWDATSGQDMGQRRTATRWVDVEVKRPTAPIADATPQAA